MEIYKINVTNTDGLVHKLDAPEGWRLMEVLRDFNMNIKAECGGCCSCATCHVYIQEEWLDKLYPQSNEELDMLDEAYDVEDNSRLSCQIIMNKNLDGLKLTIANEL